MDDLVERLDAEIKRQRETRGTYLDYGTPDPLLVEARARIQALETSLAEAEGRVIAEVVAWLRSEAEWYDQTDDGWSGFDRIAQGHREAATALETGEWKK